MFILNWKLLLFKQRTKNQQNKVLTSIIITFYFLASYHMLYFNVEPVNTDKEEGCVSLSLNTPEIGSQEIHDQISLPEKKGKFKLWI